MKNNSNKTLVIFNFSGQPIPRYQSETVETLLNSYGKVEIVHSDRYRYNLEKSLTPQLEEHFSSLVKKLNPMDELNRSKKDYVIMLPSIAAVSMSLACMTMIYVEKTPKIAHVSTDLDRRIVWLEILDIENISAAYSNNCKAA
jgi:hypothetical protein